MFSLPGGRQASLLVFFLACIGIFISFPLQATGFRLPNQSAEATARGNAQVASATGASAVYYNPAALAGGSAGEGAAAEVGVYSIDFGVDMDHSDGDHYQNASPWQHVPQAFYSQSGPRIGWGVGLYAPFGLGNDWGGETAFTTITTEAKIAYATLSPVVAYALTDNLSVGAGLTFNHMSVDLEQALGVVAGDRFHFDGSSWEVGYLLSLFWQPAERHAVGLVFRNALDHKLEGDSSVSLVPGTMTSRADVRLPGYMILGYSFRPNARWNLEADVEWGNWSRLDRVVVEDTALGDLPLEFQWQDARIYQLGATRMLGDYRLSFGYDYNESAQTTIHYNPAVADADRHFVNLGLSSDPGRFTWSITYQFGFSERNVTGSQPTLAGESADGRYTTSIHSLMWSLGYRF